MFLHRGLVFTHEAVWDWERKLTPFLYETLRKRRYGIVGKSWYVDETCLRVDGRWQHHYRAIDRDGNLSDVRLSDTRNLTAPETFFRTASWVTMMPRANSNSSTSRWRRQKWKYSQTPWLMISAGNWWCVYGLGGAAMFTADPRMVYRCEENTLPTRGAAVRGPVCHVALRLYRGVRWS